MSSTPTTLAYAVGQRWRCTGRRHDETPTLLINRVDPHPLGGEIFHVTLNGIAVRNPRLPTGVMTTMAHLPVTRQTLDLSIVELVGANLSPDPAYLPGYAEWKQAFDAGQAGSFGVSVAEVLNFVEKGLNGPLAR